MEGAINIQQQINSLIRFADDIVLLRPRERERATDTDKPNRRRKKQSEIV